jgi:uncharacterized protein
VLRLDVFGSAARGADFDPATSDADFLVAFDKNSGLSALDQFLGFSEALERCSVALSISSKPRR